MEIKNLKNLSISNLILIILNDKNGDMLRKCAEVELRKRIKNVGWDYDDLLHFDDKVIQKRGLDVENYLISPQVDVQQLMETYFMHAWKTDYYANCLLFSEKHLCNEANFASPFFSKVCSAEIGNISRRIESAETESQKDLLEFFRYLLEEREQNVRQDKQEIFRSDPVELLCHNDAMYQLDGTLATCHEFLNNCSDEEMYKLLSSNIGMFKVLILKLLDETLFNTDTVDYLAGLNFIRKDSAKLKNQKRRLLQEVRNSSGVNYDSEEMQQVFQKVKKYRYRQLM